MELAHYSSLKKTAPREDNRRESDIVPTNSLALIKSVLEKMTKRVWLSQKKMGIINGLQVLILGSESPLLVHPQKAAHNGKKYVVWRRAMHLLFCVLFISGVVLPVSFCRPTLL